MKYSIIFICTALVFSVFGFAGGWYLYSKDTDSLLNSPLIPQDLQKEYPLENYSFDNLRTYPYIARDITIEEKIESTDEFNSYIFSYSPLNKTMTGQLNIPTTVTPNTPVIVMVRGFVPHAIYSTGTGTRNGAAFFARAGYITISPDFFGYGGSDPEPADSWQARFEKPIIVSELIKSIQQKGIPIPDSPTHQTTNIGLWGHSNGGQIVLSVLETTREVFPTSLWAPVTAPFPYSVLFYSDEDDDEGKGMRLWVNQLEQDYELKKFSVTQYLDGLRGPLQIHHGSSDEAALLTWSQEFISKVEKENDRRSFQKRQYQASATQSAKAQDPFLEPIDITLYEYAGADHNLVPSWNTVVERDLTFYNEYFQFEKPTNATASGTLLQNLAI